MSLNLIKPSFHQAFIFFMLLLAALWAGDFLAIGTTADDGSVMPVGRFIDNWAARFPMTATAASVLLAVINGYMLIRITIRNSIYWTRNYTSGIFYLIIAFGFYHSYMNLKVILAGYFAIRSLMCLFSMVGRKYMCVSSTFTMSIFVGIAVLIYAPYIIFMPVLWIGLILLRNFDWREWSATLAGVLTPLFLCSYVIWAVGEGFGSVWIDLGNSLTTNSEFVMFSNVMFSRWVLLISTFVMTGLAILQIINDIHGAKRRIRRIYIFIVSMLAVLILMLLLSPGHSLYQTEMLALPMALLLPIAARSRYSWAVNICFGVMIVSAVIGEIFPAI